MIRRSVLGVLLVGVTALVTAHQFGGAGKPVGVDALCPFGGLETLFSWISGAGFIEKTAASALVLFGGTIVTAMVMRRSFCGQLCPLGALQGVFGFLGKKAFRNRPQVPQALDRPARLLKYAILVFFAVWTWQAASLVMRPYDPWAAYSHITSSELLTEFSIGIGVLVVALAGSFAYDRFFCKYLCPTGAFLGLLSRLSLLRVSRDAEACIDCGACDKACPMNVKVSAMGVVGSAECISCNECVNACPASGALTVTDPRGRRAGSPIVVTAIVVGLLASIIVASTAAGDFAWRMPSLAEAAEQQAASEGESGSGTFDSSTIKGYMSMREIADVTGIPEQGFVDRWGVPESDLGKPMKDIKDQYSFSPDDVKVWVVEELEQ